MSFCVIMHLIGRNDRAVSKRHGLAWRCMQCRVAHNASRSGPAGPVMHGHTEHEPLKQNVTIALASWATESSEARGLVSLNYSQSYLYHIASTLERSEEYHRPARLYASWTTLPSLSRSDRPVYAKTSLIGSHFRFG